MRFVCLITYLLNLLKSLAGIDRVTTSLEGHPAGYTSLLLSLRLLWRIPVQVDYQELCQDNLEGS